MDFILIIKIILLRNFFLDKFDKEIMQFYEIISLFF